MSTTRMSRVHGPRLSLLALGVAGVLAGGVPVAAGESGDPLVVTSCADDGSPGTLRSVVSTAPSGATIDLRLLTCSTITLEHGAIDFSTLSMTVLGPGADALTIDGNGQDRIFNGGSIEIDGLTLTNGVASRRGGCVNAALDVTLRASRVISCGAQGDSAYGGGIYATYAVHVEDSTIADNVAWAFTGPALGGGVASRYETAVIERSTFIGNAAAGHPGLGGAVYALGFTRVDLSTIDTNSADRGGGVYCKHSFFGMGTCSVSTSTVSGNTAYDSGGGILADRADIRFANSTIALNVAEQGVVGGVLLTEPNTVAGASTIQSTIIANNNSWPVEYAPDLDTDASQNLLIGGSNNLLTSAGHFTLLYIMADPLLGPLVDNGGPTLTHALSPESPAIDAGNNLGQFEMDQRGRARISGVAADIGAYELQTDAIFADGFETPD